MYGLGKKIAATLPLMMLLGLGAACAQEANPTSVAPGAKRSEVIAEGPNGIYIYHVKVVQAELDAVNFFNRRGPTHCRWFGVDYCALGGDRPEIGRAHV